MIGQPVPLASPQLSALSDYLSASRDAMLEDLLTLLRIETPSEDRALLLKGRDAVLALIRNRIGDPDDLHNLSGGTAGDMFSAHFSSREAPDASPVALIGHYDTVWPAGTLTEIPAEVSGDRITGPGVFDMKAGLVQAAWAVRALKALGLPIPPLRVIINGDEETGSLASRRFLEAEAMGAATAIVFEPSAEGRVKTSRKGIGIFRLEVKGIESHAGLDPTEGVSAVHELARLIGGVIELARPDVGTYVNVGTVEGGTRTNVIAGRAHADIDVRVSSEQEARRIDARLTDLAPLDPRLEVEVTGDWNRPTFVRTSDVAGLFSLATATASRLGFTLEEASVGGASDGNFIAALGIPVLDGMGAVGHGAHARTEYATLSGMVERAALAAGVLAALA